MKGQTAEVCTAVEALCEQAARETLGCQPTLIPEGGPKRQDLRLRGQGGGDVRRGEGSGGGLCGDVLARKLRDLGEAVETGRRTMCLANCEEGRMFALLLEG